MKKNKRRVLGAFCVYASTGKNNPKEIRGYAAALVKNGSFRKNVIPKPRSRLISQNHFTECLFDVSLRGVKPRDKIEPLSKVALSGFKSDALNGDWIHVEPVTLKNLSESKKIRMRLRKYLDQNS